MKFAAALLTVVTAFSAHASMKSPNAFVSPTAIVGHTNFYYIPDFEGTTRVAIDLLRNRERTSAGDYEAPLHPIARVDHGRVYISDSFPDKKALSKGALVYLAQTGACDQVSSGTCLVYWREKGLGGAILVSTRIDRNGVVYVSQSEYSRRGYNSASNANLAKQLRERLDAKYAIFTNYRPAY